MGEMTAQKSLATTVVVDYQSVRHGSDLTPLVNSALSL